MDAMYKLQNKEYVKIARRLADVIKWHDSEAAKETLIEFLHVRHDEKTDCFDVPEHLMQRIAIINICDMALTQLKDSCGEVDYAYLGLHSDAILSNILKVV